jgi:prepilin-type N-terminal cleavage/methylation domain-containing protein
MTKGFTLVEVLISMVLMLVLAAVGLRFFLVQHWTGLAQSETVAVQTALRAGAHFLATELRELGGTPGDPDILIFSADSLTYRAMRGTGVSCTRSVNAVLIQAAEFRGFRAAQAGRDSLLLHFEGADSTPSDDRWIHLPIYSVGGSSCGGSPAIQFVTSIDTAQFPLGGFAPLAPFRTFEIMQVKLYQSGSDHWLGARSVSAGETIQPLTGPLTGNGLQLVYQDSTNATTTLAEAIRSIRISLRATTSIPIRTGGGQGSPSRRTDSLHTLVALRNW